LVQQSTNLHNLRVAPIRVLLSSAFWVGGDSWLGYFVLYNAFHVPAERWLGTRRWLAIVVIAHVGATYISQGALYWAIRHGFAPHRDVYTLDYGVSYALAGVVAVLTYRLAPPWRYAYVAALVLYCVIGVVRLRDFTSLGHLSAALIGLACYPITRSRPGQWNPAEAVRALSRRVRHR
jgi:hypothetical protein